MVFDFRCRQIKDIPHRPSLFNHLDKGHLKYFKETKAGRTACYQEMNSKGLLLLKHYHENLERIQQVPPSGSENADKIISFGSGDMKVAKGFDFRIVTRIDNKDCEYLYQMKRRSCSTKIPNNIASNVYDFWEPYKDRGQVLCYDISHLENPQKAIEQILSNDKLKQAHEEGSLIIVDENIILNTGGEILNIINSLPL